MKVSRHWLQKFFDAELPLAEALAEALTFHAFEIDGIEKIGEDDVLDVKITPNRGHDALSHRGVAKELSAILNIPLVHDPLKEVPDLSPHTDLVMVTLEDATLSPRYTAGYIKNVRVGPSPEWLRRNLAALGQRTINNVVDATNFVMFNLGQPLHAFDAGKLVEKDGTYHIVVRKARLGESLKALDEKDYPLAERMLVITDGNADMPIGIGGIKGGMPARITESTKDIIIESANFSGVSVRKTAQALKLRTDASSRFEQVITPELVGYGLRAVVDLILKIAEGELVGFADVYPARSEPSKISVTLSHINTVLGTALTESDIEDAFTRLQFSYTNKAGEFEVAPPFERLDITIPEDLIEEVGRIVGYDKVGAVPLSPFPGNVEINKNFRGAERVREELIEKGYSEVFTSVFSDEGERAVLNKVDSVRPYMRSSLIPGLTAALEKNKGSKDLLGLREIKLFEIGTVWKDGKETMMVGTISEKEQAAEKPLEPEEASSYENLPLSGAERFEQYSKYPYIVRDIAFWVTGEANEETIREMIKGEAGPLAVKISLFDRFEKAGKTSLAFRIIFQSFERTLTEKEANEAMEKVAASLQAKGFEIR